MHGTFAGRGRGLIAHGHLGDLYYMEFCWERKCTWIPSQGFASYGILAGGGRWGDTYMDTISGLRILLGGLTVRGHLLYGVC